MTIIVLIICVTNCMIIILDLALRNLSHLSYNKLFVCFLTVMRCKGHLNERHIAPVRRFNVHRLLHIPENYPVFLFQTPNLWVVLLGFRIHLIRYTSETCLIHDNLNQGFPTGGQVAPLGATGY